MPAGSPWPEGWEEISNPVLAANLLKEAIREIGPNHELYGLRMTALAQNTAVDGVLFKAHSDDRVIDLGLTWKGKPENLPWPVCIIYKDLEEWLEESRADQ